MEVLRSMRHQSGLKLSENVQEEKVMQARETELYCTTKEELFKKTGLQNKSFVEFFCQQVDSLNLGIK